MSDAVVCAARESALSTPPELEVGATCRYYRPPCYAAMLGAGGRGIAAS